MVFEDFVNDFNETDPDTELTVTTNKIEITGLNADGDAYVVKDGGANHYDTSLIHQFEITYSVNSANAEVWAISDVNTGFTNFGADDIIMPVVLDEVDTAFVIVLTDAQVENLDLAFVDFGKYYITIERTATPNTTATIRTGSHAGATEATLAITDSGDSRRYLYAMAEEE